MEECVFIKGNQGMGIQSVTEMNIHLLSNDSSALYSHKGNFENYETHTLNTNILLESKEGSFRSKLPQKSSGDISLMFGLDTTNDLLAMEEEESRQSHKTSLKSTNKNIHVKFCAADLFYKKDLLHKIEMKYYTSALNHSHVWPLYSNKTAKDFHMNCVVKYDGNCITGESTLNFSNGYHPNKSLNNVNCVILNTFISEPSKFDPILSDSDCVSYKHTEKQYLQKNYGKTNAHTCYLEGVYNRLCNSLFSEPMKLILIELMHTICTNDNSAIIHNNKISVINLTTGNYSSKFSINYDRNVIIKFKKVNDKEITNHETIKCQPLVSKSHNYFNATNCVNLSSAIHFVNSKDNFHNSVMCYPNFQAKKIMLQSNYKPNYLNVGKKAMSHYLFNFRNFSKYDPCVKKVLIKVAFPNCVIYSGKMNMRNILKISTLQLYDKLSESIKCLHERLEGPSPFFAVKHNFASNIKKELDHHRFIKRPHTRCRNEPYVGKSDNTELIYIIKKCISLFKNRFVMNLKRLGKQTNQYDRRIMSVSTQTDATIFRDIYKKCNKNIGCQTRLSYMKCHCSEKRSNFPSNASYKRKIEALNLETMSSKKVFTYKYINSDSVGNESTKVNEEINTDQHGGKKGNNYCEPSNEEPKCDSISKLKPVAKKNVFQYSHSVESKMSQSHLEASASTCCRRGIRLGLSKKVRPSRKLAM